MALFHSIFGRSRHATANAVQAPNRLAWLRDLAHDVRRTIRAVRRQPAFALSVMGTLALGIGGTTAIFSIIDGLYWRTPDGVVDPGALRKVFVKRNEGNLQTPAGGAGSWVDYTSMRGNTPAFAAVGAYVGPTLVDVGRGQSAQQVRGNVVSHDFLQMLGVHAALGRLLLAEDDIAGAAPVAVIGHAFWTARFGGQVDTIGKSLSVNGKSVEIVGILPRRFVGIYAEPVDVWLPSAAADPLGIMSSARKDWRTNARMIAVQYVARLASIRGDDVAAAQSAASLRAAAAQEPTLDQTPEIVTAPLVLAADPGDGRAARVALWLAVVSTLVLLIACANVASLLLARGLARQREVALRLSLGAGSSRLVREQLTESTVLALCGGAAGVLLAYWLTSLLMQFPLLPVVGRLDGRVVLFGVAVSLATGLFFGLLPALHALRVDPASALRESRTAGTQRNSTARRALVVLQTSLTVVLLIGAALFARSLQRVSAIDSGVDLDRVLVVRVDTRFAGYTPEARDAFLELALDRVSALPAVERAALSHFEPFSGASFGIPWIAPGQTTPNSRAGFLNVVGPGYFETVGTRILRGRGIEPFDSPGSPRVAVVNEEMARLIAPDGDVVGLCIPMQSQVKAGGCTGIVGVVETQRHWYVEGKTLPLIFWARAQASNAVPFGVPALVIRTSGNPSRQIASVRGAVQGGQADLPFVSVLPLTDRVLPALMPFRLGATLFGLFSVLALALAGVGLYGLLAYFVAQRRAEIGVRRALGASTGSVVGLVVRQGLASVVVGLIAGLAAAAAGTRYLASLLFGIDPIDSVSFAAAAGCLLGVALAVTLVPAWRASRLDPTIALRQD